MGRTGLLLDARHPPAEVAASARRRAGKYRRYNRGVRRIARKFDSFEAADQAEKDYYFSLTSAERLQIMCELTALHQRNASDTVPRLARVYRVTKLPLR